MPAKSAMQRRYRKNKKMYRRLMKGSKMNVVKKEGMSYNTAKRISVPNIRRYLTKNVYNFVRYINDTEFIVQSDRLAFQGYALAFKLNQVINVTEFTSLFDTYQICKVELEFCPGS